MNAKKQCKEQCEKQGHMAGTIQTNIETTQGMISMVHVHVWTSL